MTPDERAFLDAVIADPADDTVRLVYADWLQEHGRPERAEFIRVQCAFDAYDGVAKNGIAIGRRNPKYRALWERYCATNEYEQTLVTDLPGGPWDAGSTHGAPCHAVFDRGFVSFVRCPADDWFRHADEILASHPVERVTLTTWPDSIEVEDDTYTCRFSGMTRWVSRNRFTLMSDGSPRGIFLAILSTFWPRIRFDVPAENPYVFA